ncbi:MAG: hypothetical protein H6732_01450 [Alphaproteobacteria bacterium]|nr:hypothetical protein [Alphaproteobacteria bacterium]
MMSAAAIVLGLMVLAAVIVVFLLPAPRRVVEDGPGAALRRGILSRDFLGPDPAGPPERVLGAVMDIGVGDSGLTVVAMEDGSVSLYTSRGGGALGMGAVPSVAEAAAAFRAQALAFRDELEVLDDPVPPWPPGGRAAFFLVTAGATLGSGHVPGRELERDEHELTPWFEAGKAVLEAIQAARLPTGP